MAKSFKKISDSAAAREQQSKIDALLSGTTNYPAEASPLQTPTPPTPSLQTPTPPTSPTSPTSPTPPLQSPTPSPDNPPSKNIQTKIPLPLFEALNRIKLYTGKPIVDILREALTEYVDRHKV